MPVRNYIYDAVNNNDYAIPTEKVENDNIKRVITQFTIPYKLNLYDEFFKDASITFTCCNNKYVIKNFVKTNFTYDEFVTNLIQEMSKIPQLLKIKIHKGVNECAIENNTDKTYMICGSYNIGKTFLQTTDPITLKPRTTHNLYGNYLGLGINTLIVNFLPCVTYSIPYDHSSVSEYVTSKVPPKPFNTGYITISGYSPIFNKHIKYRSTYFTHVAVEYEIIKE